MKRRIIMFFIVLFVLAPLVFFSFQYLSRAAAVPANIIVDVSKVSGPFPDRWKALAQGGEEPGTRMLGNVIPQISELYPRFIRIDHIYDFYNVVSRDQSGRLNFNFNDLDATVCDIYHAGAKPFFVLGYMPPVISNDGSLIGRPTNWNDWGLLVQKTIERYSGKNTVLPCGNLGDFWKSDIHYEVWNEPDLETFGKWSKAEYFNLYFYSVKGAESSINVLPFKIGGPVTTALYKNWIQQFVDYVTKNNLRLDFISWHHYSKHSDDYIDDVININKWLSEDPKYNAYENLPKIISEWGYDSDKNPTADTEVGAAHTLASIRNFVTANIEAAFLFEIKDGPNPSWGILDYQGNKKPRWYALQMLNNLDGNQVFLEGEGTFVTALSSIKENKINLLLTNYDVEARNFEAVPVTFINLVPGQYQLTKTYLNGQKDITSNLQAVNGEIKFSDTTAIIMKPNSIVNLELVRVD